MVGKRRYNQGCAVAHSLDLIGERWALLVVRELLLGPKRFTDLRAGLPGASADVLAQRLRELTEAGVVRRKRLPPPAGSDVYELTEWGADLEPVITQLGRWGSRSASLDTAAASSVDSVILSLRALFDARAAARFGATIGLRLDGRDFTVVVGEGRLEVSPGEADNPDATLDTEPRTLTELLHGGRSVDDALTAGDAMTTGKSTVIQRLLGLFPLPA